MQHVVFLSRSPDKRGLGELNTGLLGLWLGWVMARVFWKEPKMQTGQVRQALLMGYEQRGGGELSPIQNVSPRRGGDLST